MAGNLRLCAPESIQWFGKLFPDCLGENIMNRSLLQSDVLVATAARIASGNGGIDIDVSAARTVEVWITVSAISGTLTIDPQGSIDATNFATMQATPLAITGTGTYCIIFNRAQNNLGKKMRGYWTLSGGGSATFGVIVGRFE
jgi:hypothetical protein